MKSAITRSVIVTGLTGVIACGGGSSGGASSPTGPTASTTTSNVWSVNDDGASLHVAQFKADDGTTIDTWRANIGGQITDLRNRKSDGLEAFVQVDSNDNPTFIQDFAGNTLRINSYLEGGGVYVTLKNRFGGIWEGVVTIPTVVPPSPLRMRSVSPLLVQPRAIPPAILQDLAGLGDLYCNSKVLEILDYIKVGVCAVGVAAATTVAGPAGIGAVLACVDGAIAGKLWDATFCGALHLGTANLDSSHTISQSLGEPQSPIAHPLPIVPPKPICTYALSIGSPIDGYPNGGSFPITVTAASGCPWAAASSVSWIHVLTSSGSGTGSFMFTVDPNPGSTRTGTLTIAGHAVTFNQTALAQTPTPTANIMLPSNVLRATFHVTPPFVATDGPPCVSRATYPVVPELFTVTLSAFGYTDSGNPSVTVSLFDNLLLLGTSSASVGQSSLQGVSRTTAFSAFRAATSTIDGAANFPIISFNSILNGTVKGAVELRINKGSLSVDLTQSVSIQLDAKTGICASVGKWATIDSVQIR